MRRPRGWQRGGCCARLRCGLVCRTQDLFAERRRRIGTRIRCVAQRAAQPGITAVIAIAATALGLAVAVVVTAVASTRRHGASRSAQDADGVRTGAHTGARYAPMQVRSFFIA